MKRLFLALILLVTTILTATAQNFPVDTARINKAYKVLMSGQYNIIPNAEMLKKINEQRKNTGEPEIKGLKYEWYIDNPPGRDCVAVHSGNYWEDTTGCLLPGELISNNTITNDYFVSESTKKTKELFDFFEKYGQGGIKINVGPHFEELYKQ